MNVKAKPLLRGSGSIRHKTFQSMNFMYTYCVSLASLLCANVLRVESSRQTVEPVNLILSLRRTSAPLCERFTAPYVFSIQIYLVRGSVRPLRDP